MARAKAIERPTKSSVSEADHDDMVQKGLGWLLWETAKFDAKRAVPYLMKIRGRAPRLVLRTACETLPVETKRRILSLARKNK
jgi:3-methyladenine DNA glycosylase AlkD